MINQFAPATELEREQGIAIVREYLPEYSFLNVRWQKFTHDRKLQVQLQCPAGHEPYWVTTAAIKQGKHCKMCAYNRLRQERAKKRETVNWSEIVHQKLGDGYTVLETQWRHDSSKYGHRWYVLLQCPNPEHAPYWTAQDNIRRGSKCRKCIEAPERLTPKKREIIVQACAAAGVTFMNIVPTGVKRFQQVRCHIADADGFEYVVTLDHLRWRTFGGHKNRFLANPYGVRNLQLWCRLYRPDCEFLDDAITTMDQVYNWRYIGDGDIPEGQPREFTMTLRTFLYDATLPPPVRTWTVSYGMRRVAQFLNEHGIQYVAEQSFPDLIGLTGAKLFLDFYCPDYRVAIEVNGAQHYEPVEWFGGEEKFIRVRENDRIKKEYCAAHGIQLVELKYTDHGTRRNPCMTYQELLSSVLLQK